MRPRQIRSVLASLCLVVAAAGSAHAQCAAVRPQPETIAGAQSFTYRKTPARDLRIHVFEPANDGRAHPAIIFFFGGGWRMGNVSQFAGQARSFEARGYAAAVADYRVACRDGTTPVEAVSDAEAAYQWLRQQAAALHIDPQHIVLAGASSGGELAAVTAMTAGGGERPAALILFNPVLEFPAARRLPPGTVQAHSLSPAELPMSALPPTVIFQGDADRVVSVGTARNFCERAKTAGRTCTLYEYAGAGHGFFNSRAGGPGGVSPYEDTLDKALQFAAGLHLAAG